MVRRNLLNAVVIAAALGPLACSDDSTPGGGAGGGGGSGGTAGTGGTGGTTKDGGASDTSTSDAGGIDGGRDVVPDAGRTLPDGSVPPSGTQLVPGIISLVGVTSDNHAVYTDDTAGTLNVIPLAGGTPTSIGTADDRVLVRGSAVIRWTGSSRVTPLTVWTAAHGAKAVAMTSNATTNAVAVSADGAHVIYFDGVDASRTTGNLFIARTDGTGQTQLAASVVLNDPTCAPTFAFGGNAAAAAAYCITPSSPDGGADDAGTGDAGTADAATADAATADAAIPDAATADGVSLDVGTTDGAPPAPPPRAVVQTYGGATWTATTIATGVNPRVAIAPNGTIVLVSAPAGLLAYPAAGGASTLIDPEGGFGSFTNDGMGIIYTTPSRALKRATITAPSPTTLVASGFAGIRARSPDEKWLLGYSTAISNQDLSDLYLASATTAGTPTALSTEETAGLFGSDGFTADSTHAIYYTGIANGLGTFHSVALTGTIGAPVTHASNVWLHYAATGAKVALNDNYDESTNTADIRVVDTSVAGAPLLLVSLADGDFFIAGTKDKVVYSWRYLAGSMAGLWVTAIP
jgi:hypothetical protein